MLHVREWGYGGVTVDKWSCGRWEDGDVMVDGGRWVTFGG